MAELNDWQWAIGAAVLIASLVLGGWLSREQIDDSEIREPQVVNEPATPNTATSADDTNELSQLRQQLEARDSELKDAREEAELTLLQLHQVQEELEHYFLESRDLQQKLDAMKSEASTEETTSTITPKQQEQLNRINARLLELFKTLPASAHLNPQSPSEGRLEALVQRQHNALRRFEHLHAAASDTQHNNRRLAALGGSEPDLVAGRQVRSQLDA